MAWPNHAKGGDVRKALWRVLVAIHRYLGIAVGLMMAVWFLSGAVMMYVGFPELSETARIVRLPPLDWSSCCRVPAEGIDDDQAFERAQVETLLDRPVLRLQRTLLPDILIDLAQGTVAEINEAAARAIATDAVGRFTGRYVVVTFADELEEADQWTVGRYHADFPLFRFAFDDPDRSILYVSSASGRIVLWTTGWERFWNWLGAIPHWLYPLALRSDAEHWSEIVIWASLLGTFLTVLGLALGLTQLRRRRDGSLSPYRGLFYWHHLAGLVFGVITLTFVASGLVSMNPWGFLESRGGGERAAIAGAPLRWSAIRASLAAIRSHSTAAVSLATAPLAGRLYWLAADAGGTLTRLDSAGNPAPLAETDLAEAARRLARDRPIAEQGLMREEDAYYFGPHETAPLPVFRVILADAQATRYYIDPLSGPLIERADANRRWHRWLFAGFHRIDFAQWLRARPLWDAIVLALLLGGAAVSLTGVYLALRRVRNDVVSVFRVFGFRKIESGAR
jgi:PepSY-associated TM region